MAFRRFALLLLVTLAVAGCSGSSGDEAAPANATTAAAREDPDLAPLPGRTRRPRHLHRSETPRRTRDARRDRANRRPPTRDRTGGTPGDSALHQAVLDQQRPL